jgi:copper(I)-binding protein
VKTLPKTSVASASALFVASLAGCNPAPEPRAEEPPPAPSSRLSVGEAWARAADSGAMTAVYFTIANSGPVPDTLVAVRSDAAEEVGLHMSMEQNGTMSMAALRALPVPAEDSLLFRPLGAHVMLTRVSRPLADGDTVRLSVDFVSGKSLEVRAVVRKP